MEIISEINIKDNNSKERIINSFENVKRENPDWDWNDIETKKMKRKLKNVKYISMIKKLILHIIIHLKIKGNI